MFAFALCVVAYRMSWKLGTLARPRLLVSLLLAA